MTRAWIVAVVLSLNSVVAAQTPETIQTGTSFAVGANSQDGAGFVTPEGFRLRQNGTIVSTLPITSRDAAGNIRFDFPTGLAAGIYDILVTAYLTVTGGAVEEAPLPNAPAHIRLTVTSGPPPQPVNCVVSAWTFQSATAWSACVNGSQTRTETWTRTVTTPPANGGAACPALTETRTGTQSCTPPPPPPSVLGTTAIGATVDSGNSQSINVTRFTMGSTSNAAQSVSVYVSTPISASPNNQFQVAIYADASGAPGALVASSASRTLTGNAWNTAALTTPPTLSAKTVYWLAYNTNGLNAASNNSRYAQGSAGQTRWKDQAFGTWPATFGTAAGSSSAQTSIYATLGTGTPPPPAQCADGLDNDKDSLIDLADPGCANAADTDESNPPPTAQPLTATVGLATCPLTLNQNAPDATAGWQVQFRVDGIAFGALDTTAPYSATGTTRPGAHQWSSVWTKPGSSTTVTTPNVAGSCQ